MEADEDAANKEREKRKREKVRAAVVASLLVCRDSCRVQGGGLFRYALI